MSFFRPMEYSPYRSLEERVFVGCFWLGILLLFFWIEICIGIAIWRLIATVK